MDRQEGKTHGGGQGEERASEACTIREHKAMHEENFMSWIRKDVGEKGKSVREREGDETVVKRKCPNPVSVEAFDIFSQGEISECGSCGVDSDSEL